MTQTPSVGRRAFLKTSSAVVVGGAVLAGCTGSSSGTNDGATAHTASSPKPGDGADSGDANPFSNWLSDTGNDDGVVDKTGTSEVTVSVGASGNNGPYAFAPPAIEISTGTTVLWKWTGKGGNHNVVAQDGGFESEMQSKQGATFEQSFDSTGTYKYYCTPHKAMGMKGGIVVK